MKSYLLIISILCCVNLAAQTYYPFPTKNAIWTEMYSNEYGGEDNGFHCFALKDNDTIINGKLYHKLYLSRDTTFTEDKVIGGLREEEKKVYYYTIKPIKYQSFNTVPNTEELLYDFSLKEGDTIRGDKFRIAEAIDLIVAKIDTILIGDEYRRAFEFTIPGLPDLPDFSHPYPDARWIEGIGFERGLLFWEMDFPVGGLWSIMLCHIQKGGNTFHLPSAIGYNFLDCFYLETSSTNQPKVNPIILIKPNPLETKGIIEFNGIKYVSLKLINMFGSTVRNYDVKNASSFEIYKENLTSGTYIVQLKDIQGNIRIAKLIIK